MPASKDEADGKNVDKSLGRYKEGLLRGFSRHTVNQFIPTLFQSTKRSNQPFFYGIRRFRLWRFRLRRDFDISLKHVFFLNNQKRATNNQNQGKSFSKPYRPQAPVSTPFYTNPFLNQSQSTQCYIEQTIQP